MSNRPNTRRPMRGGDVRRAARLRSIDGIPVHMGRHLEEQARKLTETQQRIYDSLPEDRARSLDRPEYEPPDHAWGDTVLYFLSESAPAVAAPFAAAQEDGLRVHQTAWDADHRDHLPADDPEALDEYRKEHGRPAAWRHLPVDDRVKINAAALIDFALVGAEMTIEDENSALVEITRADGADPARQALRDLLFDPPAIEELDQIETAFRFATAATPAALKALPKEQALPLGPKDDSPALPAAAEPSTATAAPKPGPNTGGSSQSSKASRKPRKGGRRQAA